MSFVIVVHKYLWLLFILLAKVVDVVLVTQWLSCSYWCWGKCCNLRMAASFRFSTVLQISNGSPPVADVLSFIASTFNEPEGTELTLMRNKFPTSLFLADVLVGLWGMNSSRNVESKCFRIISITAKVYIDSWSLMEKIFETSELVVCLLPSQFLIIIELLELVINDNW